jgi:hypothetical protein
LTNFSLSATLESALESLRIERDELIQKYESVVLELDGVKHKCDRWKLEYERVQRGEDISAEGSRSARLGEVKEEDSARKGESATGESTGEGQRLLKEEGDKAAMEDRIAGVSSVSSKKFSACEAISLNVFVLAIRPMGTITPRPTAKSSQLPTITKTS